MTLALLDFRNADKRPSNAEHCHTQGNKMTASFSYTHTSNINPGESTGSDDGLRAILHL
jgi:hypothetical protein